MSKHTFIRMLLFSFAFLRHRNRTNIALGATASSHFSFIFIVYTCHSVVYITTYSRDLDLSILICQHWHLHDRWPKKSSAFLSLAPCAPLETHTHPCKTYQPWLLVRVSCQLWRRLMKRKLKTESTESILPNWSVRFESICKINRALLRLIPVFVCLLTAPLCPTCARARVCVCKGRFYNKFSENTNSDLICKISAPLAHSSSRSIPVRL